MTHKLISQQQLDYFYQSRKQLDIAITEILGPDIHLHDISQSSDISNGSKKLIEENILTHQKNRKSIHHEDVYSTLSNQNRLQKLYKDNVQLQKKMMKVKDQNQTFKQKANLWDRLKVYIMANFNKQFKLKSIKFGSSDSAILDEFLDILAQLIPQSSQFYSSRNIHVGYNVEKANELQRQMSQRIKVKLQQQCKKTIKLGIEVQILKTQNNLLRQSEQKLKNSRGRLISERQVSLQGKLAIMNNNLQYKTQQNQDLKYKISKISSEVQELHKQIGSYKVDRTQSTNQSISIQRASYQKLKNDSKYSVHELFKLKSQIVQKQDQISALIYCNRKLKNIINVARKLNNQFIHQIEYTIKNKSKQKISEYFLNKIQQANQKPQFHLTNQRFELVRLRYEHHEDDGKRSKSRA